VGAGELIDMTRDESMVGTVVALAINGYKNRGVVRALLTR